MLEKSEAIVLNEIIKKIYISRDYTQMRIDLLEMIKTLIPFQQASFYLASKEADHKLTDPVGYEITQSELQRYINEYEEADYTRWIFMNGKTMVYRETDLFPDKVRQENRYFKEIYIPASIYYSAQVSVARGIDFLGVVSLYRSKDYGDFSDVEVFILELIAGHLEHRMYTELKCEKKLLDSPGEESEFDQYYFIEKYSLTTREVEVLMLLFEGMHNKMICDKLAISPNTLKKHTVNIYNKLGINNRWELIRYKR